MTPKIANTPVCWQWTSRRAFAALLFIAPAAPSTASSQVTQATTPPETTVVGTSCFRGRPLPHCDNFWLTEFGTATPVSNIQNSMRGRLYTWELGGMRNIGSRYALGVAAFAEAGTESSGIGFRPRLRVWIADDNSIDIAPGAVIAGSSTGPAFTGHIAFNVADYAALTVHVLGIREETYSVVQNSYARTGTSTHTVVYAGGRLGSKPGTVAGILFPAAIFVLIFASGAAY